MNKISNNLTEALQNRELNRARLREYLGQYWEYFDGQAGTVFKTRFDS